MSSASSGSQPQVYRSEGRWQVQPQVYRSEGRWQVWVFPTAWSPPLFGVGGPCALGCCPRCPCRRHSHYRYRPCGSYKNHVRTGRLGVTLPEASEVVRKGCALWQLETSEKCFEHSVTGSQWEEVWKGFFSPFLENACFTWKWFLPGFCLQIAMFSFFPVVLHGIQEILLV